MSTMLGRFAKIVTIGTVGTVGACIFLPAQYYPDRLLPVYHMVNVVKAGINMTMIYKWSSKSMQQKHLQASEHLKQALRKNGGIYIKLGQLIATLDVIVPDQYRDTMMALTRGCQVSTFQNIKIIVEQQTKQSLSQNFSQFSQTPVSSASIAQVHRAKLKSGQQVAVKVQHQNLAQNVAYDLKLMGGFVKIAKIIFKDFKYQWLLEEFQNNIQKQLDFTKQAQNMKIVQKMLKQQNFKNVTVPKLLRLPTKKLLIMEYIHGYHVDEIQRLKQAGINTKEIGKTFSKVIIKMIHKYGFVHADPHSGNMLVRKDKNGKDQLVLLDHGLYQSLNERLREQYNWFWLGLILNNQDMSVRAANKMGTKNGVLLCSMLTSQTRQQLKSPDRNIFDLNPSSDKKVIMKHAKQWQPQIAQLLSQISRQFLLLLKVNEFARSIENMLGGRQIGVYEDIARCCVDNLPLSTWQKWKYKWQMWQQSRKHKH